MQIYIAKEVMKAMLNAFAGPEEIVKRWLTETLLFSFLKPTDNVAEHIRDLQLLINPSYQE